MRHPLVHIITHPANRVPGFHPGYPLDFDTFFGIARETGTVIEIDGGPHHLDLDGLLARRAVDARRAPEHRQRLPHRGATGPADATRRGHRPAGGHPAAPCRQHPAARGAQGLAVGKATRLRPVASRRQHGRPRGARDVRPGGTDVKSAWKSLCYHPDDRENRLAPAIAHAPRRGRGDPHAGHGPRASGARGTRRPGSPGRAHPGAVQHHPRFQGRLRPELRRRCLAQAARPSRARCRSRSPAACGGTTREPEKKLFIADGRKTYVYVPADKQVMVSDIPAGDRASTPILFLAGKGSLVRDFAVSAANVARRPGRRGRDQADPRKPEREYEWLTLVVDRTSLAIRMFIATDARGARRRSRSRTCARTSTRPIRRSRSRSRRASMSSRRSSRAPCAGARPAWRSRSLLLAAGCAARGPAALAPPGRAQRRLRPRRRRVDEGGARAPRRPAHEVGRSTRARVRAAEEHFTRGRRLASTGQARGGAGRSSSSPPN